MNTIKNLEKVWNNIFQNLGKPIANTLLFVVLACIKCASSNSAEIARQMSVLNGMSFNSNDVKLRRLLYNEKFQIDHQTWRCYFNLLFGLLSERDYLEEKQLIQINVDFTSIEDKFLVLFASIPFMGRGIPLYFSMRNYPKKKGKYNHKFMEEAFLRELYKLLSRKYNYVIVADRGFGNRRFMGLCKEIGFDYIVRTQGNWKIETNAQETLCMSELKRRNFTYSEVSLKASNFKTNLITSFDGESEGWYLLTSLQNTSFREITTSYGNRFKIEKMFQDFKSQGFDIEKSKILKYSNFKRMFFITLISKSLMLFTGDWIEDNCDEIKKKYLLHINLISVSSSLLYEPSLHFGMSP